MPSKQLYSNTANALFYSALNWACKNYEYVICFKGNEFKNGFGEHIYCGNSLQKINSIEDLNGLTTNDMTASYISYDFKNKLENLYSNHPSHFDFEPMAILQATCKISKQESKISIQTNEGKLAQIESSIRNHRINYKKSEPPKFEAKTSKEEYLKTIQKIRNHIIDGDVYEMCYCIEFMDTNYYLSAPDALFKKLCTEKATPFATFVKSDTQYLISASPEMFFGIEDTTIISKPIKGTIARKTNPLADLKQAQTLASSKKDKSENLMIVDLVRNDFAKICRTGSISVEELFGIYAYPTVFQMISTITGQLKSDTKFGETIQALFPMGSMTGAPKIMAMQLIEHYENFKRGLYSGSVGYFTKNGFIGNVVIRSLQYNAQTQTLGYHVGSAITYESTAENEYEECLLKAKILLDVLAL